MSDLISRQAAIEKIRNLPSVFQSGWIPYTTKSAPDMPEENPLFDNKPLELYLVTVEYSDYPFRAFWNGKFFTDGWQKLNVLAYMPLPAPYRPSDTHAP